MPDYKTAVIKITPTHPDLQVDVQLNGVAHIEVIEFLQSVQKILAKQMVDEARKHVGDDPKAQEKWLDMQRQKPDQN
jgi:hypothetical protein